VSETLLAVAFVASVTFCTTAPVAFVIFYAPSVVALVMLPTTSPVAFVIF
jgi:hypothetical protein